MNKRTAIVFGATGLVGKMLVEELIGSEQYSLVKTFVRKGSGDPVNIKTEEHIIDFGRLPDFYDLIRGDDLYICLGTTIKKAGSVAAMERIDRDLPVSIATAAVNNGVKRVAVVSSVGASPGSSNYYLRIKGEMEEKIRNAGFDHVAIVRPSMLLGERSEKRFGESAGKVLINILGFFLFGKYKKFRGIKAKDVAKAMIRILNGTDTGRIYESDELQKLASG